MIINNALYIFMSSSRLKNARYPANTKVDTPNIKLLRFSILILKKGIDEGSVRASS